MSQHAPGASAEIRDGDDVVTLRVAGEIDRTTIGTFTTAIDEVLASPATDVRVDLGGITFFGSEGVNALQSLALAMDGDSRRLRLVDVPRPVRRVLEITGTLDQFTVDP